MGIRRTLDLIVSQLETSFRLDRFLVQRVPGLSRAKAKKLVEQGLVRVNGRLIAKGCTLREGDRVSVEQTPSTDTVTAFPDTRLTLRIWFEDDYLVVVEKPAGVAAHPLRSDELGTVANALVARYPEMATVGYRPREPGLLHRLDNDTSGLLLAARKRETFRKLRAQLKAGKVDKRYLALCVGEVTAPLRIESKLASQRRHRRIVKVVSQDSPKGRNAVTEILTSRRKAALSLVEVRVYSAVRHQIRAHLASRGHPLVGDSLYGGPQMAGLQRHFLHASELNFSHPETGRLIHLSSPLPAELGQVLRQLEQF